MDPITLAIIGVSAAVGVAVISYKEIRNKNHEFQAIINVLGTYSQTYSFEECDTKIIENVRKYLHSKFGNDYEAVFNRFASLEKKKIFFKEIAKEIASEMQIDLENVDVIPLEDTTFGYTHPDGKNIVVNEMLLMEDPNQAIRTLCHEMRHCMQFQSISDNKWGFSPNRIAEWIFSFEHYNDSACVYLAYENTIVEVDARKYANAVVD